MSVARRANLAFGAIVAVASVVAVLVVGLAQSSGRELDRYQARSGKLAGAALQLQADFYAYDDQMNMYVAVLAGDQGQLQLAETTFTQAVDARRSMDRDLVTARRLAADPDTRALLDRVRRDFDAYNGFADQTRTAALAGDLSRAIHLTTVGNLEPSNDIMPTVHAVATRATRTADAQLRRVRGHQRQVQTVTVAVALLAVALLVVLRIGLQRFVLRPVAGLRTAMTEIATGVADTGRRVTAGHDDEFGEVAGAFNAMLDTLADRDAALRREQQERERDSRQSFERIRAADISARLREQQAIHGGAEVVLAELDKIIMEVQSARQAATTIDERVATATTVTQAIAEQTRQADRVVADLDTRLHQVSGMTRFIADVADQTKLLALNATIEAARAGEAGRGFAVVANEVKDLAVSTERSTVAITDTIAGLQVQATAMTTTITQMAERVGGLDESSAVLSDIATGQRQFIDNLTECLADAVTRIASMIEAAEDPPPDPGPVAQ